MRDSAAHLIPVIGFVAYSGTGKTTLIEGIIEHLVGLGYKVSVIKHTHHHFDIDQPGKDSYRHREAGASEVLLVSDQRWVLMHELKELAEPTIEEQLEKISPCDLIIVEGFKTANIPKIELWRSEHEPCKAKPLRADSDDQIVAIAYPGGSQATDKPQLRKNIKVLNLDNIQEVAEYILVISGLEKR
jgi:molybdopterin-guanine dinucleotide biosynthesis adapter protein